MKTMYKAYTRILGYDWKSADTIIELTKEYVNTIEEAKAATENVKHNGYETGDWWIVATTIDEKTFAVKTETVIKYDWFDEVGYWLALEERMKIEEKELKTAKNMKPRTEKGIVKKIKAITDAETCLTEIENKMKKWPEIEKRY